MIKFYYKLYDILFPYSKLTPVDSKSFKDTILIENIKRLKVIGIIGSLINLAIVLIIFKNYTPLKGIDVTIILRLLWIIASFTYILFIGSPIKPQYIKVKQRIIFPVAASLSLIFSALITANRSDTAYTFLYIINMLLTGSFLYFSLLEMMVIALPSFFLLIYAVIIKQQTTSLETGNMINICAVTLFSLAISFMNFKSQIIQFQYELVIKNQNEELHYLSEIDELTMVANRRKTNYILQQEWSKAKDNNVPLSLAMLDIDFFKLYNDTYGHHAGDECLKEVVNVIKESLIRQNYLVGRYGGEEFIIVLPQTNIYEAAKILENVCTNVYSKNIFHVSSKFKKVTVSIGAVSTSSWNGLSVDKMIEESDKALYKAKQTGRNKVVY